MAIKSFKDKATEKVYNKAFVKKFSSIADQAYTRLAALDAATSLNDLSTIKGNRLEALKGERAGQYSIRVNDQYRICFTWSVSDASEVELTDYH